MKPKFLLAAFLLIFGAEPALAMRCGAELVLVGQSKFDVLQRCGEPAYSDSRVEVRAVSTGGYDPRPWGSSSVVIPINIDEWVYNFGSTQLMPQLIFENGRLVKIKYLGYGR